MKFPALIRYTWVLGSIDPGVSFVTQPVLGAVPSFLALGYAGRSRRFCCPDGAAGVALAGSLPLDLICGCARLCNGRPSEVQGDWRGMTDAGVRERPGQVGDGAGPVFDVLVGKLRVPPTRPGSVRRASLIGRLAGEVSRPVVSVVAPAGYGKTTLLAQWAEHGGQAFAWVSVGEADNDPKVLLRYVAEALNAVEPIDRRVFDALASPASSVPGSVVPRLGHAFSSMSAPVVLVLDDVHLVHNSECRAALSVLADHVVAGSRLAFAGRDQPPVRVARLRAEGKVLEIGAADLSLTREEASLLLRAAEVALGATLRAYRFDR